MPAFKKVTVDVCHSDYHVTMTSCSGGCGSETGLCCGIADYKSLNVTLTCPDKTAQIKEVNYYGYKST